MLSDIPIICLVPQHVSGSFLLFSWVHFYSFRPASLSNQTPFSQWASVCSVLSYVFGPKVVSLKNHLQLSPAPCLSFFSGSDHGTTNSQGLEVGRCGREVMKKSRIVFSCHAQEPICSSVKNFIDPLLSQFLLPLYSEQVRILRHTEDGHVKISYHCHSSTIKTTDPLMNPTCAETSTSISSHSTLWLWLNHHKL